MPEPTIAFAPDAAPPADMLEPLGQILVLRTRSGTFLAHEERTRSAFPDIAVLDDGTVVAGQAVDLAHGERPAYRSLVLDDRELLEIQELARAASRSRITAGGIVDGTLCGDCGTTIIRTDIDGETIEISAHGLITDLSSSYVAKLPYPLALVVLDQWLNDMALRVEAEGQPYDEPMPQIPVSPVMGG